MITAAIIAIGLIAAGAFAYFIALPFAIFVWALKPPRSTEHEQFERQRKEAR
jgi:hypothetical protein